MCSGGTRYAGPPRAVYSVGADEIVEFTGGDVATRAAEIPDWEVVGPVANEAGRAVHETFR